MAETLFPVFEVPEIANSESYDTKFRYSAKWDPELGDFVQDGAYKVNRAEGREAYRIWCLKVCMTERQACLAYTSDIGTELTDVIGDEERDVAETMIQRTITEALKVNPRTADVREFSFTWSSKDDVSVRFIVEPIDGEEIFEITI